MKLKRNIRQNYKDCNKDCSIRHKDCNIAYHIRHKYISSQNTAVSFGSSREIDIAVAYYREGASG